MTLRELRKQINSFPKNASTQNREVRVFMYSADRQRHIASGKVDGVHVFALGDERSLECTVVAIAIAVRRATSI